MFKEVPYRVFLICLSLLFVQIEIKSAENLSTLSGVLPEKLLLANSPYQVVSDIIVEPGSTVLVEPGVILLFDAFTSLKVQGTLLAVGTKESPIVFTSKNDKFYNSSSEVDAAPYDWNGIDIFEDVAGCKFEYCTISYSVYGIKSQTKYLKINSSTFVSNGKADFTINGEKQKVPKGPFSYGQTFLDVKTTNVTSIPVDTLQKKRMWYRYGGGSLGLLGSGALIGGVALFADAKSTLNDLEAKKKRGDLTGSAGEDRKKWDEKVSQQNLSVGAMILGAIIGGAGFFGLGYSFTF